MSDTDPFPTLTGEAWAILATLDTAQLPVWQADMVRNWLGKYREIMETGLVKLAATNE